MVYVFLAEGFEEIEALAVVDILRRGNISVQTVSITNEKEVAGAHNIFVTADITIDEITDVPFCVVLPGGLPGTTNLAKSQKVEKIVKAVNDNGGIVAAICAAPSALYGFGVLSGKRATSYPGYEKQMPECIYTENTVEIDGNIITSRGPGTAHNFAFALLEKMAGKEMAEKIYKAMQYKN
ncbi:MAG: DJ-1/PfpI family protein [Clostridia bacterium]|nr:DJ-1/PfpI family protein [Clostridia bacterium]